MDGILQSASSLLAMPISVFPIILPLSLAAVPLERTLMFLTAVAVAFALMSRLRNSAVVQTMALNALRCNGQIPAHVAFIMDGNRRWARRGGLEAHQGHPYGGEKLIESLQWCLEAGVRCVTVYAFSIENFKRPPREVDEIINLALRKFQDFTDQQNVIHEKRVRVRVLGDLSLIRSDLRAAMATVMQDTARYADGPTLNICFAYTARHDMATAVRDLAILCRTGELSPEQVTESTVSACLSTGYAKGADLQTSYPDLLVRTSGETRLSDFLLWEAEDAVLSFYPVLWPDLTTWDFVNILLDYQWQRKGRENGMLNRSRRDGSCPSEFSTAGEVGADSELILKVLASTRERYLDQIRHYSEECR